MTDLERSINCINCINWRVLALTIIVIVQGVSIIINALHDIELRDKVRMLENRTRALEVHIFDPMYGDNDNDDDGGGK